MINTDNFLGDLHILTPSSAESHSDNNLDIQKFAALHREIIAWKSHVIRNNILQKTKLKMLGNTQTI